MDDERHVSLVGMMGSGKTTVGRMLAARLGRPFVDLDAEVALAAGRSVASIFAAEGEDWFREREADALQAVLAREEPVVLATGGGVVARAANREALRARSACVWLRARAGTLADRVALEADERPLLAGADDAAARATLLGELDRARAGWYEEVATLGVLDVDHLAPESVVDAIEELVAA